MPLRAECFEESSDVQTAMPPRLSKNDSRNCTLNISRKAARRVYAPSGTRWCCRERESEKAQKKLEKKEVIPKTFRTRRSLEEL